MSVIMEYMINNPVPRGTKRGTMTVKKSPPKKTRKPKTVELAEPRERVGIKFYEAGTSGIQSWSGFITEAYLASLTYPTCYPEFNRIWQSMPEMRMAKNVFSTWGRQVTPIIRLPKNASDDDKAAQQYYYEMLDDIDGGFAQLLDTYLLYTPFFGTEWLESPACLRDPNWIPPKDVDGEPDEWRSQYDDGLYGIRRFSHRSMAVFDKWDLTEKGKKLKGMWQRDYPNVPTRLDINNSLHLTVGDPTNPEGAAGLIPVYRLERKKYGYEVILGIGSERGAGYLKVNRTEQGVLSEKDKGEIAEAAKNIQSAQEGNYGYVPFGMEMELVDTPFSAANTILETIKLYSLLSLSVFNLQALGLNTLTSTGALASVSDASAMAVLGFNGLLDNFSQQFDDQIMRRLWKVNHDPKGMNAWPGATSRCHFEISHLDKDIALAELSSFVSAMDGILTYGPDDMKAIRKRSGFLPEEEPNPEDVIETAKETRTLDEKKPVDEEEKAEMAELGFNPAQPRDPKGTGTGGHWASTGESGNAENSFEKDLNGFFIGRKIKKDTYLSPDTHIGINEGEFSGKTGEITSSIKRFRVGDNTPTYRIQIDGYPKPGGWNGEITMDINTLIKSAVILE